MPIIIIFLLIPLAEVYAFLSVGDEIGIFKTLLLCIATAILGGFLVRLQGLEMLMKAQNNIRTGKLPVNEIFAGICIVLAGVLLLTPGFVTDTVGFLLLFPPFRHFLEGFLSKHTKYTVNSTSNTHNANQNQDSDIIEGNYERVEKDATPLEQKNKDI